MTADRFITALKWWQEDPSDVVDYDAWVEEGIAMARAALDSQSPAEGERTPTGYNRPPNGEPCNTADWNAGYEAGFADGKSTPGEAVLLDGTLLEPLTEEQVFRALQAAGPINASTVRILGRYWKTHPLVSNVQPKGTPVEDKPGTRFIEKTNAEYIAWCKTKYIPESLDERGMKSLDGLWAWQAQEHRYATQAPAPAPQFDEHLRRQVKIVLEGWTLPFDVRKLLETALYATPLPAPASAPVDPMHLDWAVGGAINKFFAGVDNGDGTIAFDHCDPNDINSLVAEVLSAVATTQAPAVVAGWLPMESAPKARGARFIGRTPSGRAVTAEPMYCVYDGPAQFGGWHEVERGSLIPQELTGWMPFPGESVETEGTLYEHEDGRHAVSFVLPAPFSVGEPKWHRVGPVHVHVASQPPVQGSGS